MISREPLPAKSASDLRLIEQICAGDLGSLGVLFDRYEPEVRRLLARLGQRHADSDDLIQSTFLQVIRAAPGFDPRFSVRNWLLGIAAMMARRHRHSISRTADRLAAWAQVKRPIDPVTPSEAFDSLETERRMQAALARLSPKRREAFVLVTLEGASGDEAAAALGISVNTLWTRLHHARRDLRGWLLHEDP